MTDPDTIHNAVLNHIEKAPTDAEVFDGVPDGPLSDIPTAPMVLPKDAPENPFVGDENWEEDAVTEIRKVPEFRKEPEKTAEAARPFDPTFCMM